MNKPLARSATDPRLIPYQKPQPRDMRPDMVILDGMGEDDPRVWVPLSEHVAVRPLQFTRLDKARAHYAAAGLGENYVERFIR